MRNLKIAICIILFYTNLTGCNQKTLIFPNHTLIYTKDSTCLNSVQFIDYTKKDTKYILIFSDSDCYVCDYELKDWFKILKNYPKISPIFVLNSQYPKVFLVHAQKDSILLPTILNRDFDIIKLNKFSSDIKYVIIDDKFKIICSGNIITDDKIKKLKVSK